MQVQSIGQSTQSIEEMQKGERPQGPGGPMGPMMQNLSEEEQAEVQNMLDSLTEEQKEELKAKMDKFMPQAMESGMSPEEAGSTFLEFLEEIYNSTSTTTSDSGTLSTNFDQILDTYA